MNRWNRWGRLAATAGSLLWVGTAVAGGSGTAVGGPSTGYAGRDDHDQPAASRQNTPSTAGGPTTQTSRATRDEASSTATSRDTTAMSDAMTGTISRVDADKNTIELQGDRRLKVDSSTEIRRDGQKASFSDLHEGDEVRASFASDDRTNVKRIDVMSGTGSSSGDTSTGSSSDSSSSSGRSSTHGSSSGTTYGGPSGTSSGTSKTTPPSSKPSGQ